MLARDEEEDLGEDGGEGARDDRALLRGLDGEDGTDDGEDLGDESDDGPGEDGALLGGDETPRLDGAAEDTGEEGALLRGDEGALLGAEEGALLGAELRRLDGLNGASEGDETAALLALLGLLDEDVPRTKLPCLRPVVSPG